ncbi:MAG: response regulator [Candidatus Harrisonbacteria bacterium]|nr:response regulator [Candidatus Harrisonbacteria bacterium]
MRQARHVLLVDDDPEYRDIATALLQKHGLRVSSAKDGSEGIRLCLELKPDLVLMDVQMPKKDGIETTQELHQNPQTKDIPVIFLTNLGDNNPMGINQDKRFSREFGAADYFKKGGDFSLLVEKIEDLAKK